DKNRIRGEGKVRDKGYDLGHVSRKNVSDTRDARCHLTGLGHDDSLQLALRETAPFDSGVPSCCYWSTLDDPQDGNDDVRNDQESNGRLERPYMSFGYRNAEQEQAD
ncbi:MAG: hypothetical protein Q9218_006344, partial [Villophora microphyllina]